MLVPSSGGHEGPEAAGGPSQPKMLLSSRAIRLCRAALSCDFFVLRHSFHGRRESCQNNFPPGRHCLHVGIERVKYNRSPVPRGGFPARLSCKSTNHPNAGCLTSRDPSAKEKNPGLILQRAVRAWGWVVRGPLPEPPGELQRAPSSPSVTSRTSKEEW